MTVIATSDIGSFGVPSSKALPTLGMITVLRRGTASASMTMWARCSMARTPAAIPPL